MNQNPKNKHFNDFVYSILFIFFIKKNSFSFFLSGISISNSGNINEETNSSGTSEQTTTAAAAIVSNVLTAL